MFVLMRLYNCYKNENNNEKQMTYINRPRRNR